MKRIISIAMTIVLIASLATTVAAKSTNVKTSELVYYDVLTGEEVRIQTESKNISEKIEEWLQIADSEFNYLSSPLSVTSVKAKGSDLTIDFSKEFLDQKMDSLEFSYLMMSLSNTVFEDDKYDHINLLVEGDQIEYLGEYDFGAGISRVIIEEDSTDTVIMSIPDVPDPVIVIDAGHGGIYSGASYNGVNEKAITLGIALKLKTYLQNKGATVYLTRSTDTQLSTNLNTDLGLRADVANDVDADMFISVHCNAASNTSASGVETWYPGNHDVSTSISLASNINSKISSRQSMTNRGEKTKSLKVLNDTEMTAVLVEVGFMSNSSDFGKMDSSSDQEALAYSIYLGTRKFWYGY